MPTSGQDDEYVSEWKGVGGVGGLGVTGRPSFSAVCSAPADAIVPWRALPEIGAFGVRVC